MLPLGFQIEKKGPKQIDWANQIVAAITPTFDMTLGRGVSGSVNKYAPAVNAVAVELVAIMIDRGTLGADRADANRPLALRAINSLINGA